ncbi:hypothetical protein [Paenibacillus lemnae]|uniref:Uncharacterized protein n=1 Tax=Paenibacillus lemnae TaxID=1330551 RepID=A0A848M7B4_PAELE|nr:hypothetical protein [Paenibacillus lemnae]NMO96575.1 hypothetical protein [Paenibacillus lemnae]
MYNYENKEWFERPLKTLEDEGRKTLHELLVDMGDHTFNYEKYLHSKQGEHFLFHNQLLVKYTHGMDKGVLDFWKHYGKGLVKEIHDTDTDTPWVSYVPVSAYLPENKDRKYPYLFQMNRKTDFIAESYGHAFVCAEEEVILVYPYVQPGAPFKLSLASEGRKMPSSDIYLKILDKSMEQLPVDRSRVYLTGFSSPGFRAVALACERPSLFAGIMLNSFLLPFIWDLPSEKKMAEMAACKLPIINIAGLCDYGQPYPVYQSQSGETNNGLDHNRTSEEAISRPNMWFRINDCPAVTLDEALATRDYGEDRRAEREVGIPASEAATVIIDDTNHYFADIESRDGIIRTRFIAVDNCPHWMHGSFARIQWDFVKHFSRDVSTGNSIFDGTPAPFDKY